MGAVYATVADLATYGRPLTASEQERAPALLESASALLRVEASKRGYDLDGMIAENSDYSLIARDLVVSAVIRALNASADTTPAAVQASQSGLGYSVSATYLNAGQQIYYLKNELKQLGLLRQRYGAMEVYDLGTDA